MGELCSLEYISNSIFLNGINKCLNNLRENLLEKSYTDLQERLYVLLICIKSDDLEEISLHVSSHYA
jgi:hypothetical protein